jgi:SNF2 family DNA or RNA helicase
MTGYFKEIPPYYEQQTETLRFLLDPGQTRVFDASDPGTGKTRPAIGAFAERRKNGGGKSLVLAPKSILQPAWGDDIDKFFPGTGYVIAYATNRAKAMAMDTDIYITNHDAVTWLLKNMPKKYWDDFDTIIIDESTAYKNHNSARSKAVYKLAKLFTYRELLSGSANPNSVTELWHQYKILDDGVLLGTSFWKFRSAVCEPVQVGPSANMIKWRDKPGAEHAVYDMISDITIRHPYEGGENFGIPYKIFYELPPRARKNYDDMVDIAVTMLKDGTLLTAVHASSVHQKLMQIASGAVYTGGAEGKYSEVDAGRYELVMDLIEARKQCVVGFLWKHQRAELEKAAKKRGFKYAVIDGSVNDRGRIDAIQAFQNKELRILFAHPQSAGHGLTLTAGTTTIWCSPTYNAEHFKQFNARINRRGQEKPTETILLCARDTIDEQVYDKLDGKLSSMQLLLDLLGEQE